MTHPFPESGRTNGCHIILGWRNGQISKPTRLVLVDHMAIVLPEWNDDDDATNNYVDELEVGERADVQYRV